jgi:hypothetical protein
MAEEPFSSIETALTAARTTLIMRAAAALQVQLPSGKINAQHPAIHGFRLR